MKPILLFIIYVGIILCIGGKAETSINTEEKISRLENLLMDVNSRLEILESKNHALENEKNELKSKLDDINDEVDHLKELTKMLSVRTCDEMHMYGVNKSNYYFIDPDGALNGEEPIRVYCDFTEDFGLTQISHNTEERIEVAHCDEPGCYSRPIIYDSSFDQIKALIELSESCSQLIRYDCFASPLVDEGINYGYWMDKNGETQIYWTGSNYGQHVCSCHFSEEGCAQEETLHNTCNCDSKGLSELSDVGTITNSSALPITELRFGGLLYDAQAGFHTVGKLICTGKKVEEPKATSCSALKRDGIFKNGYYNVKTDGQYSKLVYCDMTTPGYNDIDEEFIESSESHFVEVENSISDIKNVVVFSAFCKDKIYSSGSYINEFDGVYVNNGNAYDLSSGIFTAPKPGVYEFSASVYRWTNPVGWARVGIEKNNANELTFGAYAHDFNDNAGTLSFTWIMQLNQADTIRLKAIEEIHCEPYNAECVFNGKFIRSI